ncbi:hypothetical protein ACFTAO_02335 [Paenibacillus rhizoplanae]
MLVIGGLLSILAACGAKPDTASGKTDSPAAMSKGKPAPAFALNDLKGDPMKLEDLKGKKRSM